MSVARVIPKRIQDQHDANLTLGAGQDGYAIIWNNSTGKFVMGTFEVAGAVATHAALTTTHGVTGDIVGTGGTQTLSGPKTLATPIIADFTNATHTHADAAGGGTLSGYLATTGATTGATSQAQTFTNGIIGPTWKPASDSTTAIQVQNTSGTAIVTIDSTNNNVGIGTTPLWPLHISKTYTVATAASQYAQLVLAQWNAADTGVKSGLRFDAVAAHTAGTQSTIYGQFGQVTCSGNGGTTSNAFGINAQVAVSTGHTAANIYALHAGNGTATGTITNKFGVYVTAQTGATNNYGIYSVHSGFHYIAGFLGIGVTAPTALFHVSASTTARASIRVNVGTAPTTPNDGDIWNDGALSYFGTSATTNAVVNTLVLRRESTGTPAAGFGAGVRVGMASSTTANQDASLIETLWNDATHASRASDVVFSAYNVSTKREFLRGRGGASNAQIGFLGATPVSQQTSGANLTNNVTSGGTDDTIDNWTDLTTYATDAAAIRNAIYQLSRKLKQVNDGLRTLGLFT